MRAAMLAVLILGSGCTWQQRGLVAGGIGIVGGLTVAGACQTDCSGVRWASYPVISVVLPAVLWGLIEVIHVAADRDAARAAQERRDRFPAAPDADGALEDEDEVPKILLTPPKEPGPKAPDAPTH